MRKPITRESLVSQLCPLFWEDDILNLRQGRIQFGNFGVTWLSQVRRWLLGRLRLTSHLGETRFYGQTFGPGTAIKREFDPWLRPASMAKPTRTMKPSDPR